MSQRSLESLIDLIVKILRYVTIWACLLLCQALIVTDGTIHWNALILTYEVLLKQELLIICVCLLLTHPVWWLSFSKVSLIRSSARVPPVEAVIEATIIQDWLPCTAVTEGCIFVLYMGSLNAGLKIIRLESLLVEGWQGQGFVHIFWCTTLFRWLLDTLLYFWGRHVLVVVTLRLRAENIVLGISFAVASSMGTEPEFILLFQLFIAGFYIGMVKWCWKVSACNPIFIVLDRAICLLISTLALAVFYGSVVVLNLALGWVPVSITDLTIFY